MREITFTKKALALLLVLTMVVSGIYIPKNNVKVVEAAEDETEAIAVVEEGTEEVVPEGAVAKIGNEYKTSLVEALNAAKDSDSAVTITLLKDISDADGEVPTNGFTVQNTAGKKITIDGLDKSERTITAGTGVTTLFDVQCEFELTNVTVDYKGKQTAIKINAATTTSLTNVIVDAEDTGTKSGAKVKDAVIDIVAAGSHTLNITNTNIAISSNYVLDKETTQTVIKTGAAVGNAPDIKHDTRIVNINLKDSTIDSQNAVGRIGIWITRGTVANVLLDDSDVLASIDANTTSGVKNRAIYAQIVNSGLEGQTAPDLNNDSYIKSKNSTITCMMGTKDYSTPFNFKKCVAKIGNEFYETFAGAVVAAKTEADDVKIEFFDNIEIASQVKIENTGKANKIITIDGHGNNVATSAKHAISIQYSGTVNLQDMNIIHTGEQSALQVASGDSEEVKINTVINVTDVDFTVHNTTDGNIAKYGLIIVPNRGSTTLKFLRSDVTLKGKTGSYTVLLTGNDGKSKNVDITLEHCTWTVNETSGRKGITLSSSTAGSLKLIDSTIHTLDATPIYDNSGSVEITKTRATLTCDSKEAQIGTDLMSFADALSTVNGSASNITVDILKDISRTSQITFRNDNNGVVNTFDGNGHSMTVTGTGGNSIVIFGSVDGTGTYEFKNVDFVQQRDGVLLQLNKEDAVTDGTTGEVTRLAHTSKKAILKLTNVTISNTNNGGYKYGLITTLPTGSDASMQLILDKVNVTLTFDSESLGTDENGAVIRTGNDNAKTITIDLNKCNFNVSAAAKIRGIKVTESTNATINMTDSDITTKTVAPIEGNTSAGNNNTITFTGTCKLDSVAEAYKTAPVRGYDAKVGNKVYKTFGNALSNATAGATVELLQNVTDGWRNITKSVTIDGKGYTLSSNNGTDSDKHTFVIKTNATEVTFKNMDLVQKRRGFLFRTDIATTLTLENVDIDATQAPTSTEQALFYLQGKDVTTNLICNQVTVDMDATTAGIDENSAVICTGKAESKNVNITLTKCNFNTEGAEGRHGIVIMPETDATLNLTETTITTLDVLPIKDHTGNATINKTDCTLTYTGNIEASIGNNLYKTFAEALAAANEASENVTIQILKDIEIGSSNEIKNSNGASVTIEGHNHELVLNATGGQHTFMITTTQVGTVEFKNMTIKHHNRGSAIQIVDNIAGEKLTVKLTDVTIDATEPSNTTNGYEYAIINVLNKNTTDLVMTDVTVTMSTELPGKGTDPYWGIIRTGNGGSGNAKTVNMTLTNCTLDASGATTRHGIVIVPNTTANIVLENTTIKTNDVAPIKNHATTSQTITLDHCTFDATTEAFKLAPIEGYEAQVDNVVYCKFENARVAANQATESVTLKLLDDITIAEVWLNNTNGKTITFDGNGHHVTTEGGSKVHAFRINNNCTVRFVNMTVYHNNMGCFVQVQDKLDEVTLSFEDVTIHATNPVNNESNYRHALINILSSATVNFTDVIIDMDVDEEGEDNWPAIVRTGNHGGTEKTVTINVNGGDWNTEGATGRHGIVIMNTTKAKVNLVGATITTADAAPIADYSQNAVITRDEASTTTCTGDNQAYILCHKGQDSTHTLYATFADALSAANGVEGNATLGLLKDVSVSQNVSIGNAKGKLVIEGNTYTITTAGGSNNHAFNVNQVAEVEFRNMTIAHKNYGAAIRVSKAGATLTLTNVFLDAKYALDNVNETYNYTLINLEASSILNMKDSQVIMEVSKNGATNDVQWAMIRTGNTDSSNDTYKVIKINLTDCILDATKATLRSGILVVDAEVELNLKGSTKILTQDNEKCAAVRGYQGTKVAKISMDKTCLLQTGESIAYADVVKNIEAGITDACTWTYKLYENLAAFRTELGLKVPTNVPTGYIFAGWYTNKACTQEYALSNTDIETTSAYAKFVPDHVLDVKAQLSKNLLDGGDKGAIRFVTTVDNFDYEEVGFAYSVTLSGRLLKQGTFKSDVVARKLYAVGAKGGETISYTPEYEFCGVSQYFKTLTITNVPQSAFAAEITVTPFWKTLDGTTVYGEPVMKTINQGLEHHNSNGDIVDDSESSESVYTNRVVMVSDLHYTTSLDKETYDDDNWSFGAWLSKKLPNASYAAGNAFGYTQKEKVQAALDDIHGFGEKNALDAVMVLGDLTLDDYGYRNLVDNYLDDFKTDFMDELNCSSYAIAGNHDSYTNTEWKNTIGTDRQYSVVIGDAVFVMLDTFAAQHATTGSGSDYVGIDIDFLSTELQKAEYADKTIFLCSHYYQEGRHTDKDAALNELIKNDSRIVCMFRAHTHKNTTKEPASLAGSPLVDVGGYAYNGQQEDDGSYDFNTFDKSWAWGYQVVEWNESEVHIYHVKPARDYTDSNGVVHKYKGAIEDDIVITLAR